MSFFFMMLVVVVASIAVVYKTLTGYMAFGPISKIIILLLLTLSWFAPIWLRFLRRFTNGINESVYEILYKFGYLMMGFVLILSMLIIARDIIWYVIYLCSGKANAFNPNHAHAINMLNFLAFCIALVLSGYGFFEAHQMLDVKMLTVQDRRIKKETKFVVASDLHINQATSIQHIKNMINAINAQHPDYILLVGDVADDLPAKAASKIRMLSELKAKKVYISLGNHEYYNHPYAWMSEFAKLNFEVLQNSGEEIKNTGIYVAGVPDAGSALLNYTHALGGAKDLYRILLSHSPTDFKNADKNLFDIQFSGHTHGGQIFPFQYMTKKANDGYLSGLYADGYTKLFVMRGIGYWGPPMRLFAKPDIVVFTLQPQW